MPETIYKNPLAVPPEEHPPLEIELPRALPIVTGLSAQDDARRFLEHKFVETKFCRFCECSYDIEADKAALGRIIVALHDTIGFGPDNPDVCASCILDVERIFAIHKTRKKVGP